MNFLHEDSVSHSPFISLPDSQDKNWGHLTWNFSKMQFREIRSTKQTFYVDFLCYVIIWSIYAVCIYDMTLCFYISKLQNLLFFPNLP